MRDTVTYRFSNSPADASRDTREPSSSFVWFSFHVDVFLRSLSRSALQITTLSGPDRTMCIRFPSVRLSSIRLLETPPKRNNQRVFCSVSSRGWPPVRVDGDQVEVLWHLCAVLRREHMLIATDHATGNNEYSLIMTDHATTKSDLLANSIISAIRVMMWYTV